MYRDYDDERDDELYHYGKTGMKLGKHKTKPERNELAGVNDREVMATIGIAAVASLYASGISSAIAGHNIRKKTRKLEESYKQAGGGSR